MQLSNPIKGLLSNRKETWKSAVMLPVAHFLLASFVTNETNISSKQLIVKSDLSHFIIDHDVLYKYIASSFNVRPRILEKIPLLVLGKYGFSSHQDSETWYCIQTNIQQRKY